ncbi:PREDICTED: uncharacterized protein LOC109241874 [Nicotiana attenuata]|uniref:uncharacterized protein LOC109241874 n=1 Tax=Nicotiana attenuata TaxID=49451 RepID=UPI0009050EA4|nr:PREDICTED: uncharacterized protein LOC109241874 [Nicotiana attenuata]
MDFILYLALNNKLLTRDRLAQWMQIGDLRCMLCKAMPETIEHLFFECIISTTIWKKILQWQGLVRQPMAWQIEKEWAKKQGKGKSAEAQIYRMALAATIYAIWIERNMRMFQGKSKPTMSIVRHIIQEQSDRDRSNRGDEEAGLGPSVQTVL